jgi:hypothetical protein
MVTVKRASLWLAGTLSMLAVAACSAPTINGFNIVATPASLYLNPGGVTYMNVAASATGSAPVTAAIIVYNLPEGVSATPANPTVTTGSSTVITFTAAPSTVLGGTAKVQVSGYAGLASSNSIVSLNITPPG